MDITFNEGPIAVEADRGAAHPIDLDGDLRFEACGLEAEVQTANSSEQADGLQHPLPCYFATWNKDRTSRPRRQRANSDETDGEIRTGPPN